MQIVPQPHQQPHHSPLALWHLLSLDASTVAALWTLFIARCSGIGLQWTAPAAMFVAVWIIYAADRLLDARLLDTRQQLDLEARHRFHHQHRNRFLAVITLGALSLVYLLRRIDTGALHLFALLATLLAAWMLLIHARPLPPGDTRRLPKELAVGIFFPAAVFIPTVARAPWLQLALLPDAALFACVCMLNCLYLYAWEHPAPRLQDPHSSAHSTTRWATAHLTRLTALVLVISSTSAAFCLLHHSPLTMGHATGFPALACALSTALLLLLNTRRDRISAIHLRASADLVLLTPLLLLPFLHLFAPTFAR
jgi:hypothetical protein